MASLKSGTTIGTYTAIHTNNISSYALTSVPSNVITTSGGQTIAGITYFSNGESLQVYGIRGRFTNEYIHLYNKVGIGHPNGWGQGEGNTPNQGLSTYGGIVVAYGNAATSQFQGHLRIDRNWGAGDYGAEQFTIRGTYPSIALRSTNSNSKWLIHSPGSGALQFYYGGTVDDNNWANKFEIATNGNIWMEWGGWLSDLLNAKQNASTAITTSNIGSQSVSYATSAGSATSASQVSGVAVSAAQAQALKNTLDSPTLPYKCDIYVEGEGDKFYPVHFMFGDQDIWRRIIIRRGYGEEAPWDPIGTGVHHGGLLLDWEGNFGGWGGAEYSDRLRVFNESYTNVCADMFIYTHSMGYVFMLRGGHALYHIFSDQPIRGYYQEGTPDIAYNSNTLFYDDTWSGNNTYDVYAPRPLGLSEVNSSRIDGLRTKKQSLFDNRYQQISTAINTGNIGSQSVSYATNSGNSATTSQTTFSSLTVNNNSTFSGQSTWFGGYGGGSGPGIALENLSTFARFAFWGLDFYDWNYGIQMTIDNGYVSAANSFRAPIFYDSNDTTYYLDPNSSGTSLKINGGIVSTAGNGAVLLKHENSEANAWIFRENSPNWGLFWFNAGGQSGQTIGSYTTVGAELFGMNNAVTGFNPNSAWSGTDASTRAAWMLSNYSGYLWTQGTQYSETDMRAPIFYDSQNTAFYLDPNATSNLAVVNVSTINPTNTYVGNAIYFGGGNNYLNWTDSRIYSNVAIQGAEVYTAGWFRANGHQGLYNPTNNAHFYANNGTFGPWRIDGSRNGYNGLEFGLNNGNVSLMVHVNSNITGFHNTSYDWQFYWSAGTLYCFKNNYGGGTQATVLDSSNAAYAWNMNQYVRTSDSPTFQSLFLNQNPVGTTYGNGVSATPPNRIEQRVGNDDGWRIYGEAGATNEVRMVFELIDDIETAYSDQWVFRNKLTYGSYTARNEFQISGDGDAQARGSMRAPIFYASGDTNYFWQPNVNSAHRFRTANGYVEIGPMNSSWCHFQTDRANFYFGSTIYADASGFATYGGSTSMTKTDVNSPMFLVTNHSDNTKGYRIQNTSGASVSAMFTNSSNQLVIAAGALDQINLNKKVYVNGVALGVNVAPSATAGRIDASNDIVAYSTSDERFKENITPISNALDKVKTLTGVEFDWRKETKDYHGYVGHDVGVIAQQVKAVLPEAVRTNANGYLAVRYEKLIGLLIEGMKEQQAQIDELKAKLDGLTK